jgi:hypothetical protein
MSDASKDKHSPEAIVRKHIRHVELSPGVGKTIQSYAISVCEDILTDLQSARSAIESRPLDPLQQWKARPSADEIEAHYPDSQHQPDECEMCRFIHDAAKAYVSAPSHVATIIPHDHLQSGAYYWWKGNDRMPWQPVFVRPGERHPIQATHGQAYSVLFGDFVGPITAPQEGAGSSAGPAANGEPAAAVVPSSTRLRWFSDADLRRMWRAAGGEFHGPHVETGTMPEANLFRFLRELADVYARSAIEPLIEREDVEDVIDLLRRARTRLNQCVAYDHEPVIGEMDRMAVTLGQMVKADGGGPK